MATKKISEALPEASALSKVTVAAKRDGFRRAGRAWNVAPTQVEVTAEELEVLKAEAMLVVVEGWAEELPKIEK